MNTKVKAVAAGALTGLAVAQSIRVWMLQKDIKEYTRLIEGSQNNFDRLDAVNQEIFQLAQILLRHSDMREVAVDLEYDSKFDKIVAEIKSQG